MIQKMIMKLLFNLMFDNDILVVLYVYMNIVATSIEKSIKHTIFHIMNYTLSSFIVNVVSYRIFSMLYKTRIGFICMLAMFGYMYRYNTSYRMASLFITCCVVMAIGYRWLSLSIVPMNRYYIG